MRTAFLVFLILTPLLLLAQNSDLETSVTMMTKISSCNSPSFSPDGKQIAFVSNMTGIPQIWTISANGGWPNLVTALDDQIQSVLWSPVSDWLAFSLAPGGGMNQQIYFAPLCLCVKFLSAMM